MKKNPAFPSSVDPLPATAVRHVVVFSFRPGTPGPQIRELTDAFRELAINFPGVLAFEHGSNNSPEGLNLGFTHVYTLTFQDVAARDRYLPHPDHLTFAELAKRLGKVDTFVVDYIPEP